MTLEPGIKKLLDSLPPEASLEVTELPLEQALSTLRSRPDPVIPVDNPPDIEDRTIPGPEGEIAVRIYRATQIRPKGIVVNFHGGGWVSGAITNDDFFCKLLARESGYVVVSVDYRLAPEHPFPAAIDDANAAVSWAAGKASELGVDSGGVVVSGCSSGANLAAACAVRARDEGGPAIDGQILLYPALDATCKSPSFEANAEGYLLSARTMRWFWTQYLQGDENRDNPYASPLEADLAGIPRALIFSAGYDPLRDDAKAYADKLAESGVEVEYHCYDGLIHGFFRLIPTAPWVDQTIERCCRFLERLGRSGAVRRSA